MKKIIIVMMIIISLLIFFMFFKNITSLNYIDSDNIDTENYEKEHKYFNSDDYDEN